ncbi:MAG: molybdopterin-guanine dinucleotide biosynthesis protein B [Rhodospirillaceae bacterium]|nr:molybdopterin-guanine dinucleotide biosynthesis protein B [Rhodospirillaceae bacterium]MCA8931380.1 molybdopterin-guanine dinucleotide biosynthesis protein B [Rhodospirillaceae bacterium]
MKIFGLAGWSGSGKTTLLERLIPEWTGRGLKVSTVKHAHHAFDVDQPGKDSYRHRAAGATEVLIGSSRRWVMLYELRGAPEPSLDELLARMSPVDLVMVEGFKAYRHPKLEVHRAANSSPWLYPDDPMIQGIAADVPADTDLPWFDLDDAPRIAGFIWEIAPAL